MRVDLKSLVSFAKAAKLVGDGVHVSTIHRWRQRGVNGVKLETVKVGGRRYTTIELLNRFVAASSGEDAPLVASESAAADIEAQLDQLGIKDD